KPLSDIPPMQSFVRGTRTISLSPTCLPRAKSSGSDVPGEKKRARSKLTRSAQRFPEQKPNDELQGVHSRGYTQTCCKLPARVELTSSECRGGRTRCPPHL